MAAPTKSWNDELLRVCKALALYENLENGGYRSSHDDAKTILNYFSSFGLFENLSYLPENWYDHERFTMRSKRIMVKENLSLYDLLRMQPDDAERLLSYMDYLEFSRSKEWAKMSRRHRKYCALHLCEMMTRPFFHQWDLDPFLEPKRRC